MPLHYTTIQDGDIEKQPLVNGYRHGHSCECDRQQEVQSRRSRPSKSTVAIFILLLLLFVGYGRNVCQQKHDHSHLIHSNDSQLQQQQQQQSADLSNDLKYCSRGYPLDVHWDGKSVYEFGEEITSLSVEHKHKGRLSSKPGNVVVVENKKLEKSKVTFDIKLNNDRSQHAVQIDEAWSKNGLALTVLTDGYDLGYDCIKIDVLIEVPSTTVLNDLSSKFINNDVTIKDKLELSDFLAVSTVSGDLTFKKPITSSQVSLNVVSGDISGVFDMDHVNFSAASVTGDVDIAFDRLSNDSTINISATTGNVDLKVPSDFESKFAISVITGNVDVKAKDANKLHYHRSGGIIGRKINGYYGDSESPSSKIKMDVVSGKIELKYH